MPAFADSPAAFLAELVLKIPALLLAVTIHELAHGLVADRLGDPTARRAGRLTLNPLPHLDPLGALAFVLAGFGWARPVPVDIRYLRRPMRDMAWIAAAGPLANFVTGFVGLVALLSVRGSGLPSTLAEPIAGMCLWTFQFNVALGIFNLVPLPPLDGGHFLPYLLPAAAAGVLRGLEQYGPLLLLVLVVSGATRYLIGPVFDLVVRAYVWMVRLVL